jgi:hypothetical protein
MAISTWITAQAAGASQVLQGRDLGLLGLETVLSCSAIGQGSNGHVGAIVAGSLGFQLDAIHQAADTAVANALTSEMSYRGGYDASAAIGSLSNVKKGDMFTVTVAGDGGGGGAAYFTTASLEVGDVIIAEVADADTLQQERWTIVSQDLNAVQSQITANDGDITDIRSALGVADGAVDVGNFTAGIISNAGTVKAGMQELEIDAAALQAAVGINAAAADFGTFTGATITDNSTAKVCLQELEVKAELNATNVSSNDSELAALHARFPVAEKGRLYTDASDFVLDFTDNGKPQLRMTVVSASSEVDLVVSIKA